MPRTDKELPRHAIFLNKDVDPTLARFGVNKTRSRCAKDLRNGDKSTKAPSNTNKKLPIRVMPQTKSGGSSWACDRSKGGLPTCVQS